MRDIQDIVAGVLMLVPDDYRDREPLESSLIHTVNSYKSPYQAQEGLGAFFKEITNLLDIFLGEPDTEWKVKISELMRQGYNEASNTSPNVTKSPTEGSKCRLCDLPRGTKIKVPEGFITFHSIEKDTGGSYCTADWVTKGSKALSLSSITEVIYTKGNYELLLN